MYRKMLTLCVTVLFFSIFFPDELKFPEVWIGTHARDSDPLIDHPYINPGSFRVYSDHRIDPTNSSFDSSIVKEGDVVYVYTFYLEFFFSAVHPKIKFPYIY